MPRADRSIDPGGIGRPLTGVAAGPRAGLPVRACAEAARMPYWPNAGTTSFARWGSWLWRRRARPVGRRVLCAALDAVLSVRCVVPGAVQFARFAAPDGALSQTLARLRAMSWARRHQAVRPADLWVHGLD
jgi:hypothetical protein